VLDWAKANRTKTTRGQAMTGLTTKQRRFVEAYDGNATEAAREAGYGARTRPERLDAHLAEVGYQNLRKLHIMAAIEARERPRLEALIADREERQEFWTSIMRGESNGNGGMPPSMTERLRASELLARSQADFVDRQEVSGPHGGPVQTETMAKLCPPELVREYQEAIGNVLERKAALAAGENAPECP
jgi:phage terminase small subunit